MDWQDYKTLCDRPDYWSRWMLEQCIELLEPRDSSITPFLKAALENEPLARPEYFKGASQLFMYHLEMPRSLREHTYKEMHALVAQGVTSSGTASRGLGGFVEAWREFAEFDDIP